MKYLRDVSTFIHKYMNILSKSGIKAPILISESFRVYPNEYLFCYRTIHNIYLHARVGSLSVTSVLEIPHRLEIRVFHNI